MSYRIVLSTAVAFAMAVALQAQTASGNQATDKAAGQVALTGCVERADQLGASGTAATTVDSLSFVLMHAVRGTAADRQVAGTSGTNSNNTKGGIYRLDAEVAKLNPHVGHKVEVTGTVDAAAAAAAPSADTTSSANAPRVKVASVKMVSETCDR